MVLGTRLGVSLASLVVAVVDNKGHSLMHYIAEEQGSNIPM